MSIQSENYTDDKDLGNLGSDQGNEEETAGQAGPRQVSRFTRIYRSPLFNVIIVGLISFTQPGIWTALNNTGAGGAQEPYLVNGSNSLTYGIMVFGFFAVLSNKIGLKKVLIFGTLGYAPYSAALYVNIRYGTEWFVLLGGALCGLSASALWASEGAIALSYADVRQRGRFTGIWLGLRELGQLIGSSIQLSLNSKAGQKGAVGYSTYLVLIALQCLGLPLALLVSPPEKVIRPDGTGLPNIRNWTSITLKEQFKKWWQLLKRKEFFLLIPIFIGFQFNTTYLGLYLVRYFSVRARTLASLTSGLAAVFANIFWGWIFDRKRYSRPTIARGVWISLATLMTGLFAWIIKMEVEYSRTVPTITLDWNSPGFGRGFAVQVLLRFMNESHYMFVYWLIGIMFADVESLTLGVGLVRSFESVGSCLSFGIGAAKVTPMANLIVSVVMFAICVPTTTFAVWRVPERPQEGVLEGDAIVNAGAAHGPVETEAHK